MAIGWPLATLGDSLKYCRQFGALKQTGSIRAFLDLYGSALFRNVPPEQRVRFTARHGEGADTTANYLFPMDVRAFDGLNRQRSAPLIDVQDKVRFAEICADSGISHIKTLAGFRNGVPIKSACTFSEIKESIFVKPIDGKGGKGVQVWRFRDGAFSGIDGQNLGHKELELILMQQNCIIQPLIQECDFLRKFSGSAISDLRLVTAISKTGRSYPVAATIIIDSDTAAITSQGGRLYGINLTTGEINRAFDMSQTRDYSSIHTDRDDPLVGVTLPYWNEAIQLAINAHERAFSRFVALGWDIAILDTGPTLIETNQGWGAGAHQLLDGPIGASSLSAIIDEIL